MSDFDFGFGKPKNAGSNNGPNVPDIDPSKYLGGIAGVAIAILVGFILYSSFVIVKPGTMGVLVDFGEVQDEILPEGLHMIVPIKTKVVHIDVRVQRVSGKASASSKDLQIVSSGVVLNYYLDKTKVNKIFQELGLDYSRTIIEPAIQESVKAATAKFNAESLITKRQEVKELILEDIRDRLSTYAIIVTELSITDFNFSADFNKAIEDKQVAEQRALRAKNDLNRILIEAEQAKAKADGEAEAKIALAKAEAESQRLMRRTINAELIQLRAVEKWDGKLPYINGSGAMPFINVDNLQR